MVKVKGPLFSQDASGTLGGAIVFSKWKGRNYVRSHAVPANPQSALQLATRAMMTFLATSWKELTAPQQADWNALATGPNISPSNAYTRFNMNRFTQFNAPRIGPDDETAQAVVLGALTPTAGIKQISYSQAVTTDTDMFGLIVCLSPTAGFTPARPNVVQVVYGITTPVAGVITGLDPGTYYMRTAAFNIGGLKTAFVAQSAQLVVTGS